eukprot:393024_1
MAELCQEPLLQCLRNLVDSIKYFPSNTCDKDEHKETEVISSALQERSVSEEKVFSKYNGDWLRLVDVCGANIVHNDFKELYYMLLILAKYHKNCFGFEIVDVQNTYRDSTNHGWGDVKIWVKPVDQMNAHGWSHDMMHVECSMDEQKALECITGKRCDVGSEKSELSECEGSYDMVDEYHEVIEGYGVDEEKEHEKK